MDAVPGIFSKQGRYRRKPAAGTPVSLLLTFALSFLPVLALTACGHDAATAPPRDNSPAGIGDTVKDAAKPSTGNGGQSDPAAPGDDAAAAKPDAAALFDALALSTDVRESFLHGPKPHECQKYLVLHDTEGTSDPWSVINWWDGNGAGIASHFVIGTDGNVVQAVPLDMIAHHAGFGDAGHNALYGVEDESRDDRVGTTPIGGAFPDYGMNSWSIGIELVHVGGSGFYPEEQLAALDGLIAAIDAYYGFESVIIDHKAWRSGNSDTSPEFAAFLANYQQYRRHLP
ncbi:MAG: N-acetylmuramoyl-L-alanine amidase [Coriobacteriaceae bacterium]|nr:N-acetylmuramoyl-L-alanine amidase [Coriobacteriaceae bacterium]